MRHLNSHPNAARRDPKDGDLARERALSGHARHHQRQLRREATGQKFDGRAGKL